MLFGEHGQRNISAHCRGGLMPQPGQGDQHVFNVFIGIAEGFIEPVAGLLALAFRLIMKLQVSAAAAGDQVTRKYIKSAVGSLIPIVGNTLSEGVDGLFTIANGVKTSFAIAGVLIILSVMIPVLISIGVHGLTWSFCRWIAEFMNDTTIRSIADVLANSFYLMLALGGSVALMGLFSFFGIMVQVK